MQISLTVDEFLYLLELFKDEIGVLTESNDKNLSISFSFKPKCTPKTDYTFLKEKTNEFCKEQDSDNIANLNNIFIKMIIKNMTDGKK